MITYGYAKQYQYTGDGTLLIQVRMPSVHGPYNQRDAGGKTIRGYVQDKDLPWFQSVLLPHLPTEGEVVMLSSLDTTSNQWVILGLTGGSYNAGTEL